MSMGCSTVLQNHSSVCKGVCAHVYDVCVCAVCVFVQVNGGFEPDADVGPMITPEAKARCEQLIQSGIDQVGTYQASTQSSAPRCVRLLSPFCAAHYQTPTLIVQFV